MAEKRAEAQTRAEHARTVARVRRLDKLADTQDLAWSRVEAMVATRKPAEYDAAVTLLLDLQALAEREDRDAMFTERSMALRQMHTRKRALIERLDRNGL